jgi:putative ABC transport system permease protein
MADVLYLAWRYLAHHRIKTAILVASVTLIVYLPIGLRVLVNQSATALTARAEATPIVIGATGSPLELVLNSLYFESDPPARMRYAEVARVADTGFANAIPLYTPFRVRSQPIVGTNVDYFDFRGLRVSAGRRPRWVWGPGMRSSRRPKACSIWPGPIRSRCASWACSSPARRRTTSRCSWTCERRG